MHKKSYDELEFTDDFLFCHIMMANEDLCIELTEMITGRKIKSILKADDQKSVSLTYDGKGVRFDVYFEDEDNVIYDIEMQSTPKGNLQKRSRYYQGMIDLNALRSGKDYNELNESYLIFICNFEMFGKKRHIYTFENICREDRKIFLSDGSHRIFLCAEGEAGDCSDKMKDFRNHSRPNCALAAQLRAKIYGLRWVLPIAEGDLYWQNPLLFTVPKAVNSNGLSELCGEAGS